MDKAAKKERFEAVFTGPILDELVAGMNAAGMPDEVVAWHKDNLLYNTIGGKLNRGMSVVDTVEILKGSTLSEQEYQESAILGWCIELLQGFFLVSDDIMDASVTRRDQPCHYRRAVYLALILANRLDPVSRLDQEGVGMIAINDAFFLETSIYRLLRNHFKGRKYYIDIFDLFQEITEQTIYGQSLDLLTAPEDKVDLSKFSLERWQGIVIAKTAWYSFYLPVALAMRYNGITSDAAYKQTQDILIPMGEYFQAADDQLDWSAPPSVLGKIGCDIIDNKCSWSVNTALNAATKEQRQILDDNYGRKDSAAEARVKEVFRQAPISLPERFEKYEADSYAKLNQLIDGVDEAGTGMKAEVYRAFLAKVYKRSK